MTYRSETRLLLAVVTVVFVALSLDPKADRFTWFLEVVPAVVGVGILVAVHGRFKMTRLTNRLVAVHAAILIVGGYYTYAEVPIGFWVQDALDLSRNHYDRLGHFAQGFVPAIVAREVLLRTSPLRAGKWLFFIVTCICLAISAFYELIEWWTAASRGASAEAFLGTQGDPWDAQWDMMLALIGAVLAQIGVSRIQDRQLASVTKAASFLKTQESAEDARE